MLLRKPKYTASMWTSSGGRYILWVHTACRFKESCNVCESLWLLKSLSIDPLIVYKTLKCHTPLIDTYVMLRLPCRICMRWQIAYAHVFLFKGCWHWSWPISSRKRILLYSYNWLASVLVFTCLSKKKSHTRFVIRIGKHNYSLCLTGH